MDLRFLVSFVFFAIKKVRIKEKQFLFAGDDKDSANLLFSDCYFGTV